MSEDTYTKLRAIADEYSSGIEDEAFDYALMRAYNAGVEDGTPLLDIIMKARDEALSLANKRHGEAIRAREAERAAIVKLMSDRRYALHDERDRANKPAEKAELLRATAEIWGLIESIERLDHLNEGDK